jgi:hypothetical protein
MAAATDIQKRGAITSLCAGQPNLNADNHTNQSIELESPSDLTRNTQFTQCFYCFWAVGK